MPNLTLIEVRPFIFDFLFLFYTFFFAEYYCWVSRQRSLSSLCQRYSRRASPKKTRRRSKRSSRRTAPSSSSSRQPMHYFSLSPKLTGAVLIYRLYHKLHPVLTTIHNEMHTYAIDYRVAVPHNTHGRYRPKNVHRKMSKVIRKFNEQNCLVENKESVRSGFSPA